MSLILIDYSQTLILYDTVESHMLRVIQSVSGYQPPSTWFEPSHHFPEYDNVYLQSLKHNPTTSHIFRDSFFLFKEQWYVKMGINPESGRMTIRSWTKLEGDPEPHFPSGEEEDDDITAG